MSNWLTLKLFFSTISAIWRVNMNFKKLVSWLMSLAVLTALGVSGYFYLQKDITIFIGGKEYQVSTFKKTVGEVLIEAKVPVYGKDTVLPTSQQEISDKGNIRIIRAVPVKVVADGKEVNLVTVPITVREILKLAGVTLGKLDYPSKPLYASITNNDIIKVSRIKQVYIKRKNVIGFIEERRPDPTMEKGITRLVRKGEPGLSQKIVCITYLNGKEVDRSVTENKVITQPKSRLIAMGSISSVSRSGRRFEFDRIKFVEATAYSHTGRRTSSGAYPEVGTVAVDPSVIPMGSKLYVEGYGFAKAQDIGGAIVGNRIDLFMESTREALRWGRRDVKVYIIE